MEQNTIHISSNQMNLLCEFFELNGINAVLAISMCMLFACVEAGTRGVTEEEFLQQCKMIWDASKE